MKKIILSLLLLGGSYALIAQSGNTAMSNTNNMGITATTYAALPVLETYVPPEIINRMKSKYGDALYDITAIVGSPDQVQYVVRILVKNGLYRTDYDSVDGNTVSSN